MVRVGLVLILVGTAGMAWQLGDGVPVWEAYVAWSVAGLGMGLSYAPISLMMLRAAPPGREGWASRRSTWPTCSARARRRRRWRRRGRRVPGEPPGLGRSRPGVRRGRAGRRGRARSWLGACPGTLDRTPADARYSMKVRRVSRASRRRPATPRRPGGAAARTVLPRGRVGAEELDARPARRAGRAGSRRRPRRRRGPEVDDEAVVAQPLLGGPRLELGQVDVAGRELPEDAVQAAGVVRPLEAHDARLVVPGRPAAPGSGPPGRTGSGSRGGPRRPRPGSSSP